jgi:hypothetical protein
MRWFLVLVLVMATSAEATAPPPSCRIHRLEIVDVSSASRFSEGWGHQFTVEIEFEGDARGLELEWWEHVSFEGSAWTTPSVLPSDRVREGVWQDHRVVNARSPMWHPLDNAKLVAADGVRTLRIVDRPAIPLGNVRLARGGRRSYANLHRRLGIEVRVRGGGQEKAAFVYQVLSEKEGVPGACLIAHGPSSVGVNRADPPPGPMLSTGGTPGD